MFPHSEICGSKLICSSPQLIAAYHVLHRLLMPRHSPYALIRLNFLFSINHFCSYDWSFGSRSLELLEFLEHLVILSLLACKKVCIIAFFLALFRISTFRWNCIALSCLPNFILGKTNKMCCFYLSSNICSFSTQNINFYIDFFPYSIVKDQFRTISRAGRSGWTRTIDLALIRRAL